MGTDTNVKPLRELFAGPDGSSALWDALAGLAVPDAVRRYRASVACFDDRVFELGDEQLDQAWATEAGVGRWPIRVLLGHLADAELFQAWRIRRAVAEPGAVLTTWDEGAWRDAGLYESAEGPSGEAALNATAPPIGAFVAAVYTSRQWIGEWLGGLRADAWERAVLHPEWGPVRVRELVAVSTLHLEHHAWYLNAKIVKLIGEREACEPSGCANPACACGPKGEGGAG